MEGGAEETDLPLPPFPWEAPVFIRSIIVVLERDIKRLNQQRDVDDDACPEIAMLLSTWRALLRPGVILANLPEWARIRVLRIARRRINELREKAESTSDEETKANLVDDSGVFLFVANSLQKVLDPDPRSHNER
jgi:hypothetical protein